MSGVRASESGFLVFMVRVGVPGIVEQQGGRRVLEAGGGDDLVEGLRGKVTEGGIQSPVPDRSRWRARRIFEYGSGPLHGIAPVSEHEAQPAGSIRIESRGPTQLMTNSLQFAEAEEGT